MRVEVHDVDHGACITCTSPQGHRLMIDCGRSRTRPWAPSSAYFGEWITTLMVSNLDEDHVEDLVNLWAWTKIGGFFSNPTVGAFALGAMKNWEMRSGVSKAWDILLNQGPRIANWDDALGGIHWHTFWNRHGDDFTDTNNLSLATFVTYGSFRLLYGGDLETPGWKKLLERPDFRAMLPGVSVLVASHHGRENGQCDELFNLCKPQLVIFSDGPKQHETQETLNYYGARASGIVDWTRPKGAFGLQPLRRVMTTRNDGNIQIDIDPNGKWNVTRNPRPVEISSVLASFQSLGLSPLLPMADAYLGKSARG